MKIIWVSIICCSIFSTSAGVSESSKRIVVNNEKENSWLNETVWVINQNFKNPSERRKLEDSETGNTRRMCVRALDQLFSGVFKMRLPSSRRDVYVPCMSCTPTRPTRYCHKECQNSIDLVYRLCDGICLPTNFYYDADQTLSGCWSDVVDAMKIEVQRCGCSAAFHSTSPTLLLTCLLVVVTCFLLGRSPI